MKTYSELVKLKTLNERFEYLNLKSAIGDTTFGSDRYLNQLFYRSQEWRRLRNGIIIRDNGCEMALPEFYISGGIIIHHLNPATLEQIRSNDPILFDPENLVCVSKRTHNAIHFGDKSLLPTQLKERFANDTCPWKEGTDGQHSGYGKEIPWL